MTGLADVYSISDGAGLLVRNRLPMPRPGRLRNLMAITDVQPLAGSTIEACLNVNGVDSSVCVEYTAANWPNAVGSTGHVDVAVGDLISVHYSESSGIASLAFVRAGFEIGEIPSP